MLKLSFALLLAAGAAGAGQAQQPRSEPQEIVVEGTRDQNREREIREFVGALTQAPVKGQLSRFDWEVCPAAVGLSAAQNAAVVERMRTVAKAAGIKTAAAGCEPNALVIVTRDKKQFIESLHDEHPAYFSDMPRYKIGRLAESKGPAAAWQVEGRLSADGIPVPRDKLTGTYHLEVTDVPSRISPSTRPHFVASVLVVEARALAGLTVTQLADYAAMRTFARTDPSELDESTAPTILTILEAPMNSMVPVTLTEWDLGFLKALYASNENRYATQQRGEIGHLLSEELADKKGRDD